MSIYFPCIGAFMLFALTGGLQPELFGQLNPTPVGASLEATAAAEGEKEKDFLEPTLVFSAVLWAEEAVKDLFYFPLGNGNDENATAEPLLVSASEVSSTYAFYGREDAPRTLEIYHQAQSYEDEDGEIIDINGSKRKLVGTVTFPKESNDLLLILALRGNQIQGYSTPFDEKSIPAGSYRFISQSKTTYGVRFGSTSFGLSPGQGPTIPAKADDNGDLFLRIYDISDKSKPIRRASKLFVDLPTARGLVWISEKNGRATIRHIVDYGQDTPPLSLLPAPEAKPSLPVFPPPPANPPPTPATPTASPTPGR